MRRITAALLGSAFFLNLGLGLGAGLNLLGGGNASL